RVKRRVQPSPFLIELADGQQLPTTPALPPLPANSSPVLDGEVERLALTFSELAAYLHCPYAFRLRNRIGFQPQIAPELGYGTAVHHTLRLVAEHYREHGAPPSQEQVDALLDSS